jgi:hypothetical protein
MQKLEGLAAVRCGTDRVTVNLEYKTEELSIALLVVNNQNVRHCWILV